MNRIERISAILIQLQTKKVVRGQDLADRFSISLRTAYRDIRALEEAGVPIIGEAGSGYSLIDGYRLPPVMFTQEEATAFITAEKLVEKFTDTSTVKHYSSALNKIKAVLKNTDKEHLDKLDQVISVVETPYLSNSPNNHVQTILNSIARNKRLEIEYQALNTPQSSKRSLEAIGIFLWGNKWYLIAFCLLRNDYRNFRIDRIITAEISQDELKLKHPSLKTYLKTLTQEKNELIQVEIKVANSSIHCMGEQKYYNGFISEIKGENTTTMNFLTSSIDGFAKWFLLLGENAEIITPELLKEKVKSLAENILLQLKSY